MAGARHHRQLLIWQLADLLRIQTFRLTSRPGFARDLKLYSQTEDAINSVCRNISEGFGCESHAEFARFLRISRRSLNELQDAFRGAQLKGHITTTDLKPIDLTMRRLYPALNRFIAYLANTPDRARGTHTRPRPRPQGPFRRTDQ